MYTLIELDPLCPDPIEKGHVRSADLVATFTAYPWASQVQKQLNANESKICFSPSLEFTAPNGQSLCFSAVPNKGSFAFYAFYKRPKTIRSWFGLSTKCDPNFSSDLLDLSLEQSAKLIQHFGDQNYDQLERQFG